MANKNKILHIFGVLMVLIGLFLAWKQNVEAAPISISKCLSYSLAKDTDKIFTCLNENLETLKSNGIEISSITGKDIIGKVSNYQTKRGLQPDGTIGIQTGFDMGFAIGALSRTTSSCQDINISYKSNQNGRTFNPKTVTYQDDKTDNAKLIVDILKCLKLIDSKTADFKIALTEIKDGSLKSYIQTDKSSKKYVGKNFMFEIGKRFGQLGGQVTTGTETTSPPSGPTTTTGTSGTNDCPEFTDLLKKIDGVDTDSKTEEAINCLNSNRDKLKLNQFDLRTITGKDAIAKISDYQKARNLKVDGLVGIQTGFDIGFGIGRISPNNQDCKDITISYNETSNQPIFFPQFDITENDTKNKDFLLKVLGCTGLINPEKTTTLKQAFGGGDGSISDSLGILTGPNMIITKKSIKQVDKKFMYNLGRRFGASGGKVEIKNDVPAGDCLEILSKEFKNTYLSLDTNPADFATKYVYEDGLIKQIIDCIRKNNIVPGLKTGKTNEEVKSYQEIQGLGADGKIGLKTAFDLGYSIGQLSPNRTSDCQELSYDPKTSWIGALKFPSGTDDKNIAYFVKLVNALKLSDKNQVQQILKDFESLEIVKDLLITQGQNKVGGMALFYYLGKKYADCSKKSDIVKPPVYTNDPCSDKSIKNLQQSFYSSKSINIIPRNPGVIDWRDVKEVNSEECLTGTELTASLIGRLIRFFELFVAVIAVLMFVYGGFLYITAQGDEGQHDKSIHIILYGVGGIFVMILSRLIVEIFVPIGEDGLRVDRSKAFTTDIKATTEIFNFTNWVLSFASLVAICMIIYGGYLYMTAAGDDGQQESGKKTMIASVIGLFIIFSAYTIVAILLGGIGLEVQ